MSDWERFRLFNELRKTYRRRRVTQEPMHLSDCSIEVTQVHCFEGFPDVSRGTY